MDASSVWLFLLCILSSLNRLEMEEYLQNNTSCILIICWHLFLERQLLAWTFRRLCFLTLNSLREMINKLNVFAKWQEKCHTFDVCLWKQLSNTYFKHTHALQKRISKKKRKIMKLFSKHCKYMERVTIWVFAVPYDELGHFNERRAYDGLDQYDERLQTYRNFSAVSQECARILAKNGFWFTGIRGEVECFSCRERHNPITMNDSPQNFFQLHSQTCHCRIQYGQMLAIPHQLPQPNIGQVHGDENEIASPTSRTTQFNKHETQQEETAACGEWSKTVLAESNTVAESNSSASSNESVTTQSRRPETQQDEGATSNHNIENTIDESRMISADMANAGACNKDPDNRAFDRNLPVHYRSVENGTTTNVPGENTDITPEDNSSIQNRSRSFRHWPKASICNPDELAEAGFIYKGIGDIVICFTCGGEIRNWELGMDPWKEHEYYYPHCPFLAVQNKNRCLSQKGQDCVLYSRIQADFQEPTITEEISEQQGADSMESDTIFGQPTHTKSLYCQMCRIRKPNILFLPCTHVICCDKCEQKVKKCMRCHTRIEHKEKVFM